MSDSVVEIKGRYKVAEFSGGPYVLDQGPAQQESPQLLESPYRKDNYVAGHSPSYKNTYKADRRGPGHN